jgi:hypothetical protein
MATKVTLRNEETTFERLKLKAHSDLISALIQYRESAKAAGRYALSGWADDKLRELGISATQEAEDLRLQEAIAVFRNSGFVPAFVAENILREFRTMLSDHELEHLIEATAATSGN